MSKDIFEDQQQAPAAGAGGAKAKLEKQARQLAYDTKYKVKQALAAKSGGKADPAAVAKMYLAQLAKSPAPPAVKALAKKKLMGEEYIDVKGFVVDSVTDALLKVFVEKKEEVIEEVIEEEKGEQKFHIKVRDKKTGNSYHRYATRAKIAELRANPNIESVEMSHQGEKATKAKKDYDGDGKVESSSKEHAGAVHNAIQRKKGGVPDGKDTRKEEVEITEKKSEESNIGGGNLKKLSKKAVKRIDADVDGDVDTDDMKSDEMGEYVPSADGKKKIKTKVQKEDYLSNWRDELFEGNDEEEKVIDVMKGKNKIKVMPDLGEEIKACDKCGKTPCCCDKTDEEEDPRAMRTKANLVRNKLRAMGLKMSHVPEGELVEYAQGGGSAPNVPAPVAKFVDEIPSKVKTVGSKIKGAVKSIPSGYSIKGNEIQMNSNQIDGKLIEAKDGEEDKEEKEERKKAESGEKKTLKNIKNITNKKQRLDKEKYNLQRKGELPLNMSNELEGDTISEGPRGDATPVKPIGPGGSYVPVPYGPVQKFSKGGTVKKKKYQTSGYEPEGETLEEGIPLAIKLGLMAGTAVAGTKIGQTAIDKVRGMVQKKREAEAPYQKLLNQETEVEGEDLQEKPGDGYLGPTIGGVGIPNPIRIAQDAADNANRANQRKVNAVNRVLPGTASMPPYKLHNTQTSAASQRLFGMQSQSFEPEGETIEERTRYAKETGKDPQTGKPSVKGGNKPDPAFAKVSGELRKTGGMMSSRRKPIQPQGKKKEKGKVGYKERKGETGVTPVDRIRAKLAKRRAPKPDIGSRFD